MENTNKRYHKAKSYKKYPNRESTIQDKHQEQEHNPTSAEYYKKYQNPYNFSSIY